MNLAKLFTPGLWNSKPALALVFLLSAWILGGPRTDTAQAWIDPWARIPAQDEALYSHSALRMAAGEDWLTPQFLGRKLLVKPPLAMWLSAASYQLLGSLRYPHIAAAAGLATFVYATTGPVGWVLLASRSYWRDRAGLTMMDDLLLAFYVLALAVVAKDAKFEKRPSPWIFGAVVGLAVMTKWFAGFLPLLILLWTRPGWQPAVRALATCAAVAAPWHVYQLLVNREWFLAEYIGVELMTYAVSAPTQSTGENVWMFYGSRLAWLLPVLAACLWAGYRKRLQSVWLVFAGILVLATLAYGYRNASYLLPLVPVLLLAHRGWLPVYLLPLALYPGPSPPLAPAFTPFDQFQGREVLHLDPSDQLRLSLASGATVRYVFFLEHLPPNGPLDFEKLGVAVAWEDFLRRPGPEVDVVLTRDLAALRGLIEASPQRDFVLPLKVWQALAARTEHGIVHLAKVDKIWMQSRAPQPGPRPNGFAPYLARGAK